ncbi:MAG TPA: rhomboid family intramembrane serine protease [Terriglobales bacterium]|jgi:membrane associated rhomboid family serine protease|nr:rhomboid family intramembrane serine protease [Terriglobales bacterium]
MIPLRDDAPRYLTPYVNYFLLALNIAVFLYEVALPARARDLLVFQFGVVPAKVTALLHGVPAVAPEVALVPILTSMFLHASFLHVLSNMWVLYIFGDNIESYLGHFKYLLFYLVSGVSASLVHILFNLHSKIPSVGASGAIAGVMGAYFVLYPSARVLTIMPFIFVFFLWLPAWIVLGYWFVAQFLSGAATAIAASSQTTGGVAFWAHVGGFVAGILLLKAFPARNRRLRYGSR